MWSCDVVLDLAIPGAVHSVAIIFFDSSRLVEFGRFFTS